MSPLKKIVVAILTLEARIVLSRHKPRVIAVTGSVGKTGAKDAIFAVLEGHMHVRKSRKSLNSEMGVPLAILGLSSAWRNPVVWMKNIIQGAIVALFEKQYPRTLVLEIGADRPGDIRAVAKWLRPDIAVLTHVPEIPVHVEFFSSPEEVVMEKKSLVDHLKPGGVVFVNGDDVRLKNALKDFKGNVVHFGLDAHNEYAGTQSEIAYEDGKPAGMRFTMRKGDASRTVLIRGALGSPRVYSAVVAVAIGDMLGVSMQHAIDALAKWVPTSGRMRLVPGANGSTIIDDTYNSSPVAALAALDTLHAVQGGRHIAVLGDMMELGKYSADAHKEVGARAAVSANMLIVVGFRSRATAEAALDAGMSDSRVRAYELQEAVRAGRELRDELQRSDVVLVKGSQSVRMERAVEELMANPSDAADLLVRQDAQWKKRT